MVPILGSFWVSVLLTHFPSSEAELAFSRQARVVSSQMFADCGEDTHSHVRVYMFSHS